MGIPNHIHKSLNLEKKVQHKNLPSFLRWALHRSGKADSGKDSHPLPTSASFVRIPSAG